MVIPPYNPLFPTQDRWRQVTDPETVEYVQRIQEARAMGALDMDTYHRLMQEARVMADRKRKPVEQKPLPPLQDLVDGSLKGNRTQHWLKQMLGTPSHQQPIQRLDMEVQDWPVPSLHATAWSSVSASGARDPASVFRYRAR